MSSAPASDHVAFVLLDSPLLPSLETVRAKLKGVFPSSLVVGKVDRSQEGFSFTVGPHHVVAVLAAFPVPDHAAERSAEFSASRFMDYSPPTAHAAHLSIVFTPAPTMERLEALELFAALLAALAEAASAVGVYWGAAHATHPVDYLVDTVRADVPRAGIWCGVALARASDRPGAASFVSLGLHQLGRTELEVTTTDPESGFAVFFNLVCYLSTLGRDFLDGETVSDGDGPPQKIRRARSPVDPTAPVSRIDLASSKVASSP